MRLVFLGTPAFAVPTLERLVQAGHEVAAVVTQPDRPRGRGQNAAPSPVKETAARLGLPVYQPERVRRPEALEFLRGVGADAMVVVGYGQIIPQTVIDLAPLGIINVHASLLPKYRGAAPIQWAIAEGEKVSGVTSMLLNEGLDTGDILLQRELAIAPDDTAVTYGQRLSGVGAELMVETLRKLEAGSLTPQPQNHSRASLAPILKKEDAQADFKSPAQRIYNRLRGFQPWPGCYTSFKGKKLAVTSAKAHSYSGNQPDGELLVDRDQLFVICGEKSALQLLEVQPEGKRRMTAADFIRGYRPQSGDKLGA